MPVDELEPQLAEVPEEPVRQSRSVDERKVGVDDRKVPVEMDRVAAERDDEQLDPEPGERLAELRCAGVVAADRRPEGSEVAAQLDERSALDQPCSRDCPQDRHAKSAEPREDRRLLAAAQRGCHPPDDRAAGNGQERVAEVHRLRETLVERFEQLDLHPFALQRRNESRVLLLDALHVRRLGTVPVPAPAVVDERTGCRIPRVGANLGELVAGSPHQHDTQLPDLVCRAPGASPDALELVRVVERRLRLGRKERVVVRRRRELRRRHRRRRSGSCTVHRLSNIQDAGCLF